MTKVENSGYVVINRLEFELILQACFKRKIDGRDGDSVYESLKDHLLEEAKECHYAPAYIFETIETSLGEMRVPQHRYVYYKSILGPNATEDDVVRVSKQRYEQGFIVHHIDGIDTNNRIENLYECSKAEHRHLHFIPFVDKLKLKAETLNKVIEANKKGAN